MAIIKMNVDPLNSLVLKIIQRIEKINALGADLFIDEDEFYIFSENPTPDFNFEQHELSHLKLINWLYITIFERGKPNVDCLSQHKKSFDKDFAIKKIDELQINNRQGSKDDWFYLMLGKLKNEISEISTLLISAINNDLFKINSEFFVELNEDQLSDDSEIDKYIWNMYGYETKSEIFPNYSDEKKYDIVKNDNTWDQLKIEMDKCLLKYSELYFTNGYKKLAHHLRTKYFHDLEFEKIGDQKILDNCKSWYFYSCGNSFPHTNEDYDKSNSKLLEISLEYFNELLKTIEIIREVEKNIKNDIIDKWKIQRDKFFPYYMYDEIISESAIYFGIENLDPKQVRKQNWQKWEKELLNFKFDDVKDIKGSVRAQAVKLVEDYFISDKTIFIPIDSKDILNAFPQEPGPLVGKLLKYSKKLFTEKKSGKEQILKIIKKEVLTDYPEYLTQENEYYQQKIDQLIDILE